VRVRDFGSVAPQALKKVRRPWGGENAGIGSSSFPIMALPAGPSFRAFAQVFTFLPRTTTFIYTLTLHLLLPHLFSTKHIDF